MKLLALLLCAAPLFGATYYVDYVNGLDTNNGTSKATPWQRAPGMYTCASNCASATINPGDSIILKGGITWQNAAFPWYPTFAGSSGNQIYIGIDKTWYDSSCGSSWCRPIIDLQQMGTNHGAFSALQVVIDDIDGGYTTWDNFEIINWNTGPDTTPGNYAAELFELSSASHGASNIIVENMYVHKWYNPYISIGTGNLTSGSCVISNYVPYSYSPSPVTAWVSVGGGIQVQSLPQGTNIPEGNGQPVLSALSGSNPYTVTFTSSAGCASANVTAAVIQIGTDTGIVFAGNTAGDTGTIVQNNVIDGSDTAEVQWNPYSDCGLTEGNNNACLASVEVGRYGPQIWRNNVMQYVFTGFVGSATEVGGNLIQNIRLGLNPTGHTNVWEEEPALGTTTAHYNNLIRHMNFPNPSIPGGVGNVGVPLMVAPASSGSTEYTFNNILYDMTQNIVIEINSLQGLVGTVNVFNNSMEGGPDSSNVGGPAYEGFSCTVTTCKVQNNYIATTAASPWGTCGGGCTQTTNLAQTPTTATADGYTISQTYAYSPTTSGSPTVGAGTSVSSLCSGLSALPVAQSACSLSTVYGATYNTTNHTATIGPLPSYSRSSTPDIGSYQFQTPSAATAPSGSLTPSGAIAQ